MSSVDRRPNLHPNGTSHGSIATPDKPYAGEFLFEFGDIAICFAGIGVSHERDCFLLAECGFSDSLNALVFFAVGDVHEYRCAHRLGSHVAILVNVSPGSGSRGWIN